MWATSRQTALRMAAYEGPGSGGRSVVVLHGLGTGVDVLREVRPGLDPFAQLAALGWNVLALDWPGHGRSGGPRGHLTYRAAMDAAATAIATAGQRWGGPVALFGTALGGALAFYAALEEGAVTAVACHGVLDLRDIRPVLQRTRQGVLLPLAGLARQRLADTHQRSVGVPLAAVVAPGDMAADPRTARALRRHPQAVRTYTLAGLGSILLSPEDKPDVSAQRTPTFVAVGGADRVQTEVVARSVVARVTCPAELLVLPGAGHQLLLEHPRALLPAVDAFLGRYC